MWRFSHCDTSCGWMLEWVYRDWDSLELIQSQHWSVLALITLHRHYEFLQDSTGAALCWCRSRIITVICIKVLSGSRFVCVRSLLDGRYWPGSRVHQHVSSFSSCCLSARQSSLHPHFSLHLSLFLSHRIVNQDVGLHLFYTFPSESCEIPFYQNDDKKNTERCHLSFICKCFLQKCR